MKVQTFTPLRLTKSVQRLALNILINFYFFIFFTILSSAVYAQQPSCNISGALNANFSASGGDNVNITADVFNTNSGTTYNWTFVQNTSNAVIASGQGTTSVVVQAGTTGGNFTILLTVNNPAQSNQQSYSCTCSKSVSVNNTGNQDR